MPTTTTNAAVELRLNPKPFSLCYDGCEEQCNKHLDRHVAHKARNFSYEECMQTCEFLLMIKSKENSKPTTLLPAAVVETNYEEDLIVDQEASMVMPLIELPDSDLFADLFSESSGTESAENLVAKDLELENIALPILAVLEVDLDASTVIEEPPVGKSELVERVLTHTASEEMTADASFQKPVVQSATIALPVLAVLKVELDANDSFQEPVPVAKRQIWPFGKKEGTTSRKSFFSRSNVEESPRQSPSKKKFGFKTQNEKRKVFFGKIWKKMKSIF